MMSKQRISAYALAVLSSTTVQADIVSECAKNVLAYDARVNVGHQDYMLVHNSIRPAGGGLYYFGAEHSRDPSHPQFNQLKQAFVKFNPTIIFFEGPNRGIAESDDDTIKSRGESGYIRWLASQKGIPAKGLELAPLEQLRAAGGLFPLDQVLLFFVVREATRLRTREGLQGKDLDNAVAGLLERISNLAKAENFSLPFDNLEGLQNAYSVYWPDSSWREAKADWFSPLKTSAETGGIFTNDINKADSHLRDLHMYRVIAQATRSGQRVFAVVGRDHVPRQAQALKCALGGNPPL